MNKIIFFGILFSIFYSTVVFSQNLAVKTSAGVDISGQQYAVAGLTSETELHVDYGEIYIENSSANSIDVGCRRYELSVSPGTFNFYCWSLCYNPMSAGSNPIHNDIGTVSIAAGANDIASFKSAHKPNTLGGSNTYRFVFYNTTDSNDSTWFDVVYDVTTGIGGLIESDYQIRTFGGQSIEVAFSGYTNYTSEFVMLNMLGSEVLRAPVDADKKLVSTSGLNSGVYFAGLKVNGELLYSKKVFIP